ncbi:MAG: methylenetetrahydrofolate--tRNA-(uracil(54)-C(5))-methyltransferase (FADH(2)-oxidizing) TrmFO, partial [Clostridia bacterium]|nr:methylenetetrahydrofolate--tRNA-(uracil(54)-C(5))-methyltransferase (FADH(2)-oxidizing) TrmFO [Clostridia bacterium]
MTEIKIIGGGLAGCEAAYQLLKRGHAVKLYEMRPTVKTDIHKTADLAELVCSNSLKSLDENTSQGLLKSELAMLDSLILKAANKHAVPAGGALAVEREAFSREIEKTLSDFDNFTLVRQECAEIADNTIVASGPLTSGKLAESIDKLLGGSRLFFFDAVAPIVTFDSVDMTKAYFQGRYGKGGDDYLNCPLDKDEYYRFVEELAGAERVILRDFEKGDVFNACMPLEVMAERGAESLRFGPFRPVGLTNPDGKRPYAVLQLRKEDNYNRLYNLVG